MKVKTKYLLLFYIIGFVYVQKLSAQEISEEIDILKPITPVVKPFPKIQLQPKMPSYTDIKPKMKYEIYDNKITSENETKNIINAGLIQTRSKYIPLFYVKLGAGNMQNYLADFNFNSFPSKHLKYGFNIRHRSIKGNTLDDQTINTNKILGFFTLDNPKTSINIKLNYDQNLFNFYGADTLGQMPPTNITSEDKEHGIRNISSIISINNDTTNNSFHYIITSSSHSLSTSRNVSENAFSLNSNIALNNYVSFDSNIDLNFIKLQNISISNHRFSVSPYLKFTTNSFDFKVGLNTNVFTEKNTQLAAYPYIHSNYHIIRDYMVIFGQLSGHREIMSYKKLLDINPYIDNDITISNTNKKLNLKFGLKIAPSAVIEFKTALTYNQIDNMPLFTNKENKVDKFNIVYVNGAQAMIVNSELNINYNDKISSNLELTLSNYTLKDNIKPTYTPTVITSLNNIIKPINNLKLNILVSYLSKQNAYIGESLNHIETLPSFLNLSLGAEYEFKYVSIFTKVNNLLNSRYEIFKFYPGFNLNFLAGLTIRI
ncbi:MAG: TonB-dependent receptor [Solitalea-like symbiont of Tyrophagus putrescentiae]